MKHKNILLMILLGLFILVMEGGVFGLEIPPNVNVQGVLRNVNGEVVTGQYKFYLRIYDAVNGGNKLWEESQTLQVEGGVYNAYLGAVNPIPVDLFEKNKAVYLEVQIQFGNNPPFPPMPRKPITSVGYAYQAEHAERADVLLGSATDVDCTGCISSIEVSFPWAKGVSAGGPAENLQCTGCVGSIHIADESIASVDISNSAIVTIKIADGAVTLSKLAKDSVDSSKIVDGSIGGVDIAGNAIGSSHIADGEVKDVDLGVNYALGVSKGGPAANLQCNVCVDQNEVDFNFALGKSKGGAAVNVDCPGGCIDETEVTFNYAGSTSKGGAANDLACSGCVSETEVSFPWAMGTAAGGDAVGLSCTNCVQKEEVSFYYAKSDAKEGDALGLKCTECVEGGEVDFKYAGSKISKGGAAYDLECDPVGCVSTTDLADSSVTSSKIAPGAITPDMLPIATTSTRGAVVVGYNLSIDVGGVLTAKTGTTAGTVAVGDHTHPELVKYDLLPTGSNLIYSWENKDKWALICGNGSVNLFTGDSIEGSGVFRFDGHSCWRWDAGGFIQIDTTKRYYGRVWARKVSGDGKFYAGYVAYDKDKNVLTGNGGTYGYFIAAGANPGGGTYYEGMIGGEGSNINQFPPGTRYIKPLIIANYMGSGATDVDSFAIYSMDVAGDLNCSGCVHLGDISDNAITGAKVMDGSLSGADIQDGSIETADLKDGAVTSQKILDGTIQTADIGDGAVTSAKISDGTIETADLKDGAVTSQKISDGTIATADLSDGAVTSVKIADGTIATADIGDGAVTEIKIANNSVTSAKIKDGEITSADIKDGSIGFADFGKNACTNDQIIKWNDASNQWICAKDEGAYYNAGFGLNLSGSTFSVKLSDLDPVYVNEGQPLSISTAMLQDNSVTSAKIGDGQVTSADILDGTIATADISNNAVTTAKIADNAITSIKIADGNVATADIADNAVTSVKIQDGQVTSADILDGTIATIDIGNLQVSDAKIAGPITGSKVEPAKTTSRGTVQVGSYLSVDANGILSVPVGTSAGKVCPGELCAIISPSLDITVPEGRKLIFAETDSDSVDLMEVTPPNDDEVNLRLTLRDNYSHGERFSIYAESCCGFPSHDVHNFWANGDAYHRGYLEIGGDFKCTNCIHSGEIADGQVTSADIADGAITNTDIGNVNASKVSAGTFGASVGGGSYTFPSNLTVSGGIYASGDLIDFPETSDTVSAMSKIRLWGNRYHLGIQNGTMRLGAGSRFRFYIGENDDITKQGLYAVLTSTGLRLGDGTDPGRRLEVIGDSYVSGSSFVSGNLGVGTISALEKLHLSPATAGTMIRIGNYTGIGEEYSSGATVIGDNVKLSKSVAQMQIMTSHSTYGARALRMRFDTGFTFHAITGSVSAGNAFSNELVRITNTGNVGIGTNNPSYKLDVSGDIRATGTIYGTFSGTINAANVSAGKFGANTGGGVYQFPDKVGIAMSPSERLDVTGNIRASGKIYTTEPTGYAQTYLQQWGLLGNGAIYIEPAGGQTLWLTDQLSATGKVHVVMNRLAVGPNSSTENLWLRKDGYGYFGGRVGIQTTAPGDALQINQNWFDNNTNNWGGGIRLYGNAPSISFWESDDGAHRWMWHLSGDTMHLYRRPSGGGWEEKLYVQPSLFKSNIPVFIEANYLHVKSEGTKLRVGAAWGIPGLYSCDEGARPLTLGSCSGQRVYIGESTNDAFIEAGSGNAYFKGRVGVGTTSPDPMAKVHAMGTNIGGTNVISDGNDRPTIQVEGQYPNLIVKGQGNSNHSATVGLWAFDGGNNTYQWNIGVGQNAKFSIGYCVNNANPHCGINDYGSASVMAFLNNGNVGIGTASPDMKLTVNGSVRLGANSSPVYIGGNKTGAFLRLNDESWLSDPQNGWIHVRNGADTGWGSWKFGTLDVDSQLCIKGDCRTSWPAGGNISGSGSTNYIAKFTAGTTIGNSQIYDNGANVGIGTTAPSDKLEVAGGYIVPAGGYGLNWRDNIWGGSGDDAWIRYYSEGGENTKLQIGINNDADDDIEFYQAGAPRLTIYNGNVGIGTTSPYKRLHIVQGAGISMSAFQTDANDRPGIILSGHYPEINLFSQVGNSSHGPTIRLGSYNAGTSGAWKHWSIGTAGQEATFLDIGYAENQWNPYCGIRNACGPTFMTINNNGRVGIGTLSPAYRLHVAGDIYSDGGWLRVSGQKGLYFQSYGGGWYMNDGTWISAYNSKSVYTSNIMRADNGFQVDGKQVIHADGYRFYPNNDVSSNLSQGIFWNGDSGDYAIFREGGAWSNPYPDLRIAFHTGIKLGAHYSYNGIRFYNDSNMTTQTFSVGDGDNNTRVYYDLIVNGTVSAPKICLAGDCRTAWPTGVSGGGTANYITKWTGGSSIGNSTLTDDGSTVTFTGHGVVNGELYYRNWIRKLGSGSSGLYWQEGVGAGYRIYPQNQQDMRFRCQVPNCSIVGTIQNETPRGYIHWTTGNEIGFLNASRNWSFRVDNSNNAQVYGSLTVNNEIYIGNWLRWSDNDGLYWSNNGWNLYPENNWSFRVRSGSGGASALRFNTAGADRNFVYCDSGNNIGFLTTGGAWALRVDNSKNAHVYGNLGIGTSPSSIPLLVQDNADSDGESALFIGRRISGGDPRTYFSFRHISGPAQWFGIAIDSGGNFAIHRSALGDAIFINHGNLNVGIGTTNPGQKLDVNGYVKGTGLCIGGDCRTSWPGGGNISGSGSTNYIAKFTGGTSIGNSTIFDNGNICIGDSNPAYKLDVRGNMRTTGRYYSNEWIQFDNYTGIYSPINGAHLYPNNGSYGSWRIAGSRNGWHGLEFDAEGGQLSLMMGHTSHKWGTQVTGVHNNSYGWLWRFEHDSLYTGRFYDHNDTGYYVDPNGGSRMNLVYPNTIWLANWGWTGDDGNWGKIQASSGHIYIQPAYNSSDYIIFRWGGDNRIYFRLNGNVDTYRPSFRTNGGYLVINPGVNDKNLYLNWDVGGQVWANAHIRPLGGYGIIWQDNPWGGGGDQAGIQYYSEGGENTKLRIWNYNDGNDDILIQTQNGAPITLEGPAQINQGANFRGTIWGGPWGANPTINANADNHTGGGIAVSDDGGFFDFNDAWIQFRGSYGLWIKGQLRVEGRMWSDGGCPDPFTYRGTTYCQDGRCNKVCMTGWYYCYNFQDAQRRCWAWGGHICSYDEIYILSRAYGTSPSGIGYWNGDWIGNRSTDDNAYCVNYPYDVNNFEGQCNKNDCRWYNCCFNLQNIP